MSRLTPFRALRPRADLAAHVSSVPYDVVSTEEARALVSGRPESFLYVTRAEIDLPTGGDPHAAAVYERGRANLDALKSDGRLVVDPEPGLYLYRLRMGEHVQTGVAGCFSVDEYEQGTIKKHEKTRRDKEDDRTRHIVTLRAQTGVVFLTYRARTGIDRIVDGVTAGSPLYDFVSTDGVAHTLWKVPDEAGDTLVSAFAELPALYIADGHHRAASAWRARGEIRSGAAVHPPAPEAGDPGTFLAVAFPDDQVQILPYHRVVRDLGGRSPEALVADLDQRFDSVEASPQPQQRGTFSAYLSGTWRSFRLPAPEHGSAIAALDCELLQRHVLTPLLGIEDLRTDERIDFVGGIRGTGELERRVDAGDAAVAFALYPVAADDLFAVSDAGESMPPKSTWFEPKLRDGLLVHEI